MHYKNGVEVKIGEIVIGQTHNSQQKLRIGKVLEQMPLQGSCNVKLLVFGFNPVERPKEDDDTFFRQFVGSEFLTTIREFEGQKHTIETAVDYADAKNLLRAQDCFRSLNAQIDYGQYDSPYFSITSDF